MIPAGMRMPATRGSKCASSSCSPTKYQGAFAGSGGVGEAPQGGGEGHAEGEHHGEGPEGDDHVAGEEVRPGEHGVVDVPLLGGHRLAVNDAEQPYASLWVGCRSLGRRLGHVRRTLCEGAGAAPSHREAVLAHPPEVDGEEHDEGAWEDGDMQRVDAAGSPVRSGRHR